MDQIQEQIDGVEEEAGIAKDLYDLVEQYQVPVNPEDMAVYQVYIIVPILHLHVCIIVLGNNKNAIMVIYPTVVTIFQD